MLFNSNNPIRRFTTHLVESNKFDYFIIVLIILSSINLIVDNPLEDPKGTKKYIVDLLDIIFTSIFVLEFLLKIVSYGFCFNGKKSYLRNTWNLIDFFIVSCSVIYIYLIHFRFSL